MKSMFSMRRKAMVWTDKRAKLIQELLGGMRVRVSAREGRAC